MAQLAAEITEFVKGGAADDELAAERELLGRMLDDAQAHLGVMVNAAIASQTEPERIYLAGLHATDLLYSMAEVVIAWLLLRQAEVALPKVGEDAFYQGKVAAARFLVRDVAPRAAARRAAAEGDDGWLMRLPVEAF